VHVSIYIYIYISVCLIIPSSLLDYCLDTNVVL